MLKIALPIITACVFLIGCDFNGTKTNDKDSHQNDSLSYSYKKYDKQLFDCEKVDSPCAKVSLQSLKVEGEGNAIDSINAKIERRFLNLYGESEEGLEAYESSEELINAFLDEYARIVKDMPDYTSEWLLERTVEVNFNKLGMFGVSFVDFSYTGGAHGNSLLLYSNFNSATGNFIGLQDLLKYEEPLLIAADIIFRESQNIQASTKFEDAGFWFDDTGFYLPDNFFLSDMGIHFFYNPYEIAPYSYGAVELFISWDEADEFLQDEWKHLPENVIANSSIPASSEA
jgi:hypothetical protein